MKRITLAAAVLSLVVVAGGCSSINPDAARVNGQTLKRFDFERDLQSIEEAFVAAANQAATPAAKAKSSPTTVAPATNRADAAALLSVELQAQIVHDEVVSRKLTASALPDTDATLLDATRSGLSEQVFTNLPKSMRAKWIQRGRERLALQEAVAGTAVIDDAAIKARYDRDAGNYLQICFSAIVVKDAAGLAAAQSQLAAGKTFGEVAAALSIDASAADNGVIKSGIEPCWLASDLQAQLAQVYNVLAALPVGKPSDPIQTTTGVILLQTDKVSPADITRVRDTIASSLQQEQAQVLPALVQQLMTKANVKVDPRYGDWDPTTGTVVASKTLDPTTRSGAATSRSAPSGADTTTTTG